MYNTTVVERVLICGDRHWTAKHIMMQVLQQLKPKVVIEGEARGADRQGGECAEKLEMQVEQYPANWGLYGMAAGPIRNREMIEKGKPELVLAFHDNVMKSKGTRNMIMIANAKGVLVNLYNSGGQVQYNFSIL